MATSARPWDSPAVAHLNTGLFSHAAGAWPIKRL